MFPNYTDKDVVAEINKYPLALRPSLFSQWEEQKRDPYYVQFPNCSWLYKRIILRMHDHLGEPHTEYCGNKCDYHGPSHELRGPGSGINTTKEIIAVPTNAANRTYNP
jgi:hypothetical protein